MKFSRTGWLILGTGILGLVSVILSINYSQQLREQESSLNEVQVLRRTMTQITTEKQLLGAQASQAQEKLAQVTSLLDSAQAHFPATNDGIDYSAEIFRVAGNFALKVVDLKVSEPTKGKRGDIDFLMTYIDVKLQGGRNDIVGFIGAIANSTFFTNVSMDKVDITDMDQEKPTLDISLVAFGYQG